MATCPECDAEIDVSEDDLEEMEPGDPWDCQACGSRLRVVSLDPLEFESDDEDDEEEEKADGDETESEGVEEEDDDDEDDDSGSGDWDE